MSGQRIAMGFRRTAAHVVWATAALTTAVILLGQATPAGAACPNEAIREAQTSESLPLGTTELPACMALEMVSPPKKLAQVAFAPAFSADGERVLFKSTAALAGTPGLHSAFGDYYVATRRAGGWETAPTAPPGEAAIVTGSNSGGPYAFTPSLDRWLLFGATQAQSQVATLQFFQGGLDGTFSPFSPVLTAMDDSGRENLPTSVIESSWRGTSRDLSTTLFSPRFATTVYLEGDPLGSAASSLNEYVVSRDSGGESSVELLARDKDGVIHGGFCGTRLGNDRLDQGAISADGSRIYFTTRPDQPGAVAGVWPECDTDNPLRVMIREMVAGEPVIEELVPGGPTEAPDLYQGASQDGTLVYLTTTRQLAVSDTDTGPGCSAEPGASGGCDLYLYDSSLPEGERVVQVSAGNPGTPTPGQGANVLSSITAISGDGSHAYLVAEGVLATNANPEDATATEGEPNLYLYERETGELTFLATLSEEDKGALWGVERSYAADAFAAPLLSGEEGGDGHILLFASSAPLTESDADGSARDVFRYDTEEDTLLCISCAQPGAPADVLVNPYDGLLPAPSFTEPGRWVSEDGETVAFGTAEPLVDGDEDGKTNPYLWKEGQLARLPAEIVASGELPTVSASGTEVGFTAGKALLAVDGDTARDVYLARADGGFPNPTSPVLCDPLSEGSCQGQVPTAAAIPPPATGSFVGPGNPKATRSCTRPKVRRKGRCVKPRKRPARKRAGNDRRGRR